MEAARRIEAAGTSDPQRHEDAPPIPRKRSADPDADADPDPDALQALGDEIATLAAHIHAANQRLLTLIAEFDRRRGWEPAGHRDCVAWLEARTGMSRVTARQHVSTARALTELPPRRRPRR